MSSEDQSELQPKTCEDYTTCNKQESTCSKQESICLNLSGEPSISDKAPFVRLIVLEPACSFGAKINIGPNSSPEPRTLGIAMETNEDGVLNGEEDNGILRFHLKDVDLIFENSTQPNKSERPILHLKPACFADDEWYANVQVRIFIARNGELFRMTTTQMFELGKRCRPLELQVEPDVDAIKLELRFVYLSYHKMPKFESDGDLQIFFSNKNDDPIHVDKSLLALYAPKLVNSIENIPPHGSFDVQSGVNREQFLELLYQVYRTNRPVWADLKTLCDAVNKLGGPILLWKLRQFFVDDSQQSTMKKASDAAEFGIDDATRQLCYDAVKSGEWNQLNERGFDAQKFFGHEIYRLLVMPAVIEAMKDRNSVDPAVSTQLYEQKYPLPKPRFANPYEAGNLYVIQLQVDNVLYYVNRGLLKIYGCLDKLAFVQNNVYRPLVSPDLKQELDQSNLQLGQIVTPVLELMYGVIDHVPANILPACLIFAHDHGIRAIVEDLEKFLIDEPNDKPETLLNHLLTAEKYNLMNLRRRSLWQLELNKLQNIGLEMIALPDYQKLTPSMQMNVEDRMCRGWAQSNPKLATGKPTNTPAFYLQFLGPERAKAEPVLDEMDLQTVKLIGAYSFEQLVDG